MLEWPTAVKEFADELFRAQYLSDSTTDSQNRVYRPGPASKARTLAELAPYGVLRRPLSRCEAYIHICVIVAEVGQRLSDKSIPHGAFSPSRPET